MPIVNLPTATDRINSDCVYRGRLATLVVLAAVVLLLHVLTPTAPHLWHGLHVFFRNLLFLPVFLAAIWFGMRSTVLVLACISIVYVGHVWLQWSNNVAENLNQYGHVISLWAVGVTAGAMASAERRAKQAMLDMQEGALAGLVTALDAREHGTGQHSLRVRDYAVRIGSAMGMGEHALHVIGQGALLHDIGKIGIPDEILLKPGELSSTEWELMRQHTQIGHEILNRVPLLNDVADIVLTHHERFDGTGYPAGLKGEEIPVGARIFAVADVFDALTTDRPYRQAMAVERATSMIVEESGKHFDPEVIDAFVSAQLRCLSKPRDRGVIEYRSAHIGQ